MPVGIADSRIREEHLPEMSGRVKIVTIDSRDLQKEGRRAKQDEGRVVGGGVV